MSEDWGADHIPRPRGTRPSGSNLVEALSAAQHMPLDALEDAILRPDAIAETVLAAVAQAATGTSLTSRERNLVFWGMHVLGQARETRLSGPLLAWLRRPFDELAETFGEIVETTLPKIVVGTFDGDADRLEAALADREADEVIRWGLFALSVLLFGRAWFRFTPNRTPRQMPMLLGFLLVALFIWIAENAGTFANAWIYPAQRGGWSAVVGC